MVFMKHNSLKSDVFFNPIFIPCFSGSRFFRVQIFQGPGPGLSRSWSRVRVQVLEVALSFPVNNNSQLQIVQPEFTTRKHMVKLSAEADNGGVL